jgi:hypothetical protein
MTQTLVLVDLPDGMVCLGLSDFRAPLAKGNSYLFEGKWYEITEIKEFMGFCGRDGRQLTGTEKLVKVLTAEYGAGRQGASLLAGMRDIGSAKKPEETTASGIVIATTAMVEREFDHVVLLKTRAATSSEALPLLRLTADGLTEALHADGEVQSES